MSYTSDEFACLDLCSANSECRWFTFYSPTNLCLLFEDCQVLDEECQECLTGQPDCIPSELICNIPGSCSGILDHFEELPSAESCLKRCQSLSGCRWMTFVQDPPQCFLFKTCPELDESCENCISSERRCIAGDFFTYSFLI